MPITCGEFLSQYPHIKIEMQLQNKTELHRKLLQGEIDISVCSQIVNSIGSDIQLPDQLILFCSKQHPLANKSDISKKELESYPMFSCFSQSKQVQSMLNEVIDSLNKVSTIKVGSIEQVMAGLEKSASPLSALSTSMPRNMSLSERAETNSSSSSTSTTRGIIAPLLEMRPASLCIANRTIAKAQSNLQVVGEGT